MSAREIAVLAERIRTRVWAIRMSMPNARLSYSLCYAIVDDRGEVHVVDPGWPSPENRAALAALLAEVGASVEKVATVVATHLHPDHLGLAAWLRAHSSAALVLHAREDDAIDRLLSEQKGPHDIAARFDEWGVPRRRRGELEVSAWGSEVPFEGAADIRVEDGDLLPIPGADFRVVHTPGHTPGHICLVSQRDQLILTGDHVLPIIHPGIGLGGPVDGNPLAQYLAALERTEEFDSCEVAPGHEHGFTGLAMRCKSIASHHLNRTRHVAALREERPTASVWEVASALRWASGWDGLRGPHLVSALKQTTMHLDLIASGAAERYLERERRLRTG